MLYDPMCLINAHPEVIPGIENKMDYIIVDEYQDTSTLQHAFTRLIAGQRAKVIAVGDPDQTIYEFAGANIDNILRHFQDDFSRTDEVKEMTMPHTFRYGHSIALAASHLISKNKARKNVICIAHEQNVQSKVQVTRTNGNDTELVVHQLKEYLSSKTPPEDIALLFRVWAQAVPIELSLLEQGIPYSSDGPSLFQRPEIETLLAALRMSAGLFQQYSVEVRARYLHNMLTLPHIGLKGQLVQQLVQHLQQLEFGYGDAMQAFSLQLRDISQYQLDKVRTRAKIFQHLERAGSRKSAVELLRTYIQDTELVDSLRSMSLNEQRTEEQILAVRGFQSFLRGLNSDPLTSCLHIDELIERHQQRQQYKQANNQQKAITLSSSHRAKGLEWSVVLIPGLTRQYWPFTRDDDLSTLSANSIESERRLLYVAMTRAKQQLHLFTCRESDDNWCSDKNLMVSPFFGEMSLRHCLPLAENIYQDDDDNLLEQATQTGLTNISRRYLESIKPELAKPLKKVRSWKNPKTSNTKKGQKPKALLESILDTDAPWQQNRRLRHAIFGDGRVTQVNDSSFVISFDRREFGSKRFARQEQVKHLFEVIG